MTVGAAWRLPTASIVTNAIALPREWRIRPVADLTAVESAIFIIPIRFLLCRPLIIFCAGQQYYCLLLPLNSPGTGAGLLQSYPALSHVPLGFIGSFICMGLEAKKSLVVGWKSSSLQFVGVM